MSQFLDPEQLHDEATIVDLHIHPSMSQQIFRRDVTLRQATRYAWDLEPVRASFPNMASGGYGAFLSVLHVPEFGLLQDFPQLNLMRILHPQQWAKIMAENQFEVLLQLIKDIEGLADISNPKSKVKVARSYAELEAILALPKAERPMALIHAVEGAHALGPMTQSTATTLKNLEALHKRGVAYITLAHFYPNIVTSPCFPFPSRFAGLSLLLRKLRGERKPSIWRDLSRGLYEGSNASNHNVGKAVVHRMMELGMLVDLSHCTPIARQQVYDIANEFDKPIPLLMTHVGAHAINPSPYNPTDKEIIHIANKGGLIGVIFMNYWLMPNETRYTIDAIAQTIAHIADIGGVESVGIGTDFDGFTSPPDDLQDASFLIRLTERLVSMGYSENDIQLMLGGNALRVLANGWHSGA